jgi:hypothetical protein
VLHLLEDQDPGALAHHEAVAVAIEGPAGGAGVVVAGRHGAHGAEAADGERVTEASAPPAMTTSARAVLDGAHRLADGVGAGGAGRHRAPVRPLGAEQDADLPGAMLMIICGMKNGLMRRTPFSAATRQVSSRLPMPPMPLPTMTPTRSAFFSVVDLKPEARAPSWRPPPRTG